MKKAKPRFLTVYTVSATVNEPDRPLGHLILGSYLSRGEAIRACADHVIRQMEVMAKMRALAQEDEVVVEALKKAGFSEDDIEGLFGPQVSGWSIPDRVHNILLAAIVGWIGGESCYILQSGDDRYEYRFDVDENDVEGKGGLQLWICITTGKDYGDHDPEFEDPYPEVFLSEGAAMKCALDDLRVFLEGRSKEDVAAIMKDAEESLSNNGYFEFILDEHSFMEVPEGSAPRCRRWDIWSTPLDIGDGAPKVQRA